MARRALLGLLPAASALFLLAATPSARAEGTYFLLEAGAGFSEAAYQGGDPGIYYGLRSGLTFKPVGMPIRFHLLLGAGLRSSQLVGAQSGVLFAAEQYDLDLYVSSRIVVPILGARLYTEAGVGDRLSFQSLVRDPRLGNLSVSSDQLMLFLAAGVQFRLTERFSAGLRLELNPLDPDRTLISEVTGHAPTETRVTGMVHLGVHF